MTHPLVQQVLDLADAATTADGVAPFGEQPLLALRRHADDPTALLQTATDGDALVGAALWPDDEPNSIEVVIHPGHRRQGRGGALLREVLADRPDARFWAHGKLDGAQATAASLRMEVVRELWRMERPMTEPPELRAVPDGFTARAFRPGHDEDAWLRVNARAFDYHPEQGRMTRADLDARMAESWFDAEGLILLEDDTTGEVAGSHWTKIPPDEEGLGEVYVVAVDPAYQGRGLGGPLTTLGLQHLHARGVRTVELYVEADNTPAVATYRRLGFEPASIDAMYAPAG